MRRESGGGHILVQLEHRFDSSGVERRSKRDVRILLGRESEDFQFDSGKVDVVES